KMDMSSGPTIEVLPPPPLDIINDFLTNLPDILVFDPNEQTANKNDMWVFSEFEYLPQEIKHKIFSEYPTKYMLSINKNMLSETVKDSYYHNICLNQGITKKDIAKY